MGGLLVSATRSDSRFFTARILTGVGNDHCLRPSESGPKTTVDYVLLTAQT